VIEVKMAEKEVNRLCRAVDVLIEFVQTASGVRDEVAVFGFDQYAERA
jgi:hypothetical protein